MFVTEPIGRGVLDAFAGMTICFAATHVSFAPSSCCTMSQMPTTMSVSRRLPVTHAAASLSKCKP